MAKADKSVIDLALDEAEEIIAAKAEVKADEEPEAEAEVAPEPEPVEESDQEAKEEPVESQAQPEPEAVEAEPVAEPVGIEPPRFWSAEKKAIFAKAPQEVQQAVLEYEKQRTEWANRLATESEQGRTYRQKVEESFAPYAETLKAAGISDPIDAAKQLLEWNSVFEKDPVSGVLSLMQENGLTLEDLQQGGFQAAPQGPQYQDPRIEKALSEAAEAKKLAQEQLELVQQQQQQRFMAEVERFKTGKDSAGNVRKSFAEMYAPQISQMAEQIQRTTPNVSLHDALEHAYEEVLSSARRAFGVTTQAQQIQPAKAKAAASSVVGAPSNGGVAKKPKAKSIEEALDMAEEQLGLR